MYEYVMKMILSAFAFVLSCGFVVDVVVVDDAAHSLCGVHQCHRCSLADKSLYLLIKLKPISCHSPRGLNCVSLSGAQVRFMLPLAFYVLDVSHQLRSNFLTT